ncbi:MAG: hypothetical protein A6F71_08850 [Cycloclasticus sp. symbiont of Poecilosclerida sp. M]|nr:MAG: hypothetical protein A6F71_08850 [Cycloclasticus sp. symbiont of Poecilosclerida sp. M]
MIIFSYYSLECSTLEDTSKERETFIINMVLPVLIIIGDFFMLFPLTICAGSLVEAGDYMAKVSTGPCPSQQIYEDITVDVLQLLSAQFGLRPLGLAMTYAAESCEQVAEANPDSPSGMYWVNSGEGNPVQVLCQF